MKISSHENHIKDQLMPLTSNVSLAYSSVSSEKKSRALVPLAGTNSISFNGKIHPHSRESVSLIVTLKRSYEGNNERFIPWEDLITNGGDLHERDEQNYSPLMHAARYRFYRAVDIFLNKNANPNIIGIDGKNAVRLFVEAIIGRGQSRAFSNTFQNLIRVSSKDILQEEETQIAIFMYYCSIDNLELAKSSELLQRDLNCCYSQRTLLMLASKAGAISIVTYLLNQKADPNISNDDGETALLLAIQNQHEQVVCILIEFCADVNGVFPEKTFSWCEPIRLPLIFFAVYTGRKCFVEMLYNAGVDIDALDGKKRTPLMIAISRLEKSTEYQGLISFLASKSGCLNACSDKGETAVTLFIEQDDRAIIMEQDDRRIVIEQDGKRVVIEKNDKAIIEFITEKCKDKPDVSISPRMERFLEVVYKDKVKQTDRMLLISAKGEKSLGVVDKVPDKGQHVAPAFPLKNCSEIFSLDRGGDFVYPYHLKMPYNNSMLFLDKKNKNRLISFLDVVFKKINIFFKVFFLNISGFFEWFINTENDDFFIFSG